MTLRARLLNAALLAAVIAGAIWLGSLVYHNRFGGHDEGAGTTWQGSVSTEGNVTTVLNEAGSVWGGRARLVEEAVLGVESGAPEYMLGNRVGIAVDDDRMYIADPSVPVVRVYDHDARYIMDIGARGQGPGEYSELRSVTVGPDGRLYVYADRRINLFSTSGESIGTWPHEKAMDSFTQPIFADDGLLYTNDLVGEAFDPLEWQHGMVAAGPEGPHGDPIAVPVFEWERKGNLRRFPSGAWVNERPPFVPRLLWVMSPSRSMIAGVSGDYRFEIHDIDGSVTVVENAWEKVPVSPEEAEWNRESITSSRTRDDPGWIWNGPPIPDHKPAYDGLFVGTDGRIWVSRIVGVERLDTCDEDPTNPEGRVARNCWRQLYGYDVFDADGHYLGAVDVPGQRRLINAVMDGDQVFAYVEDDEGIGRVKRYSLALPEAD